MDVGKDWFYLSLSGLRDGGLADVKASDRTLSYRGLQIHSRALVGSSKVGFVVDLYGGCYFLPLLNSELRWVNIIQASLYSMWKSCDEEDRWYGATEEPSAASNPSYAVVVSAVVLLALVYQYLTGNVDIGSSKAYSRSSLDFRDIYVAIVLFLGAYVWIKFREVAPLRGVHKRKRVDKQGRTKVVYDARLTPPLWNGQTVPKLDLGQFATPQEAHNKFLVAAFYYNRDAGLLDGWFQVPPMSEEERSLTGLELRAWVVGQAKKVYEDFKKKAEALLLQELFEAFENEETPEQDEGLAFPNSHSLGFQEGSALPVPRLSPNTESEMSLNGRDHWDLLQTRVSAQHQQISDQQQQISLQQQQIYLQQQQIYLQHQQIYLQHRQIQELGAQMLQFQIQQQQLQESRIQNPQ